MDKKFVRHELKTPLSVINGYFSMLKQGDFGPLQLTPEQGEIFLKIENNLTDLLSKINSLLAD